MQQVMAVMFVERSSERGSGRGSWVCARVLMQKVMAVMFVERCSERGSGRRSRVQNPSKVIRPYAPWTRG